MVKNCYKYSKNAYTGEWLIFFCFRFYGGALGRYITHYCKHSTEDVNHIISSWPEMSFRYYLPIRRDVVANTVLKTPTSKIDPTDKFKHLQDLEYV